MLFRSAPLLLCRGAEDMPEAALEARMGKEAGAADGGDAGERTGSRGRCARLPRAGREELGPPASRVRGSAEGGARRRRSEEHTSELQSLRRISYAVFCLKKKFF